MDYIGLSPGLCSAERALCFLTHCTSDFISVMKPLALCLCCAEFQFHLLAPYYHISDKLGCMVITNEVLYVT